MCRDASVEDSGIIATAQRAADDLLRQMRVPVGKALSLATPHEFDVAVAHLAAELRASTAASDVEAVRAAVRALDIDWRGATAAQRSAAVKAALGAARAVVAAAPRRIEAPLGRAADAVARAARTDAREHQRLAISANLNALDHRAIAYVRRSTGLFVRDEYGRRVDAFGRRARDVVARGLEEGFGRDDIASDLAAAASRAFVDRSRTYWNVVASSFVGEGRSLSQLSAFAEAGIDRYAISAVLDEVTTDVCRWLDGKVLQTRDAIRSFERVEASDDPIAIKRDRPWVRERVTDDGRRELVVRRDDDATTLARIERSGVGARDDRGEYSRAIDDRELAPAGIGAPPFHGHCRSTLIPT